MIRLTLAAALAVLANHCPQHSADCPPERAGNGAVISADADGDGRADHCTP